MASALHSARLPRLLVNVRVQVVVVHVLGRVLAAHVHVLAPIRDVEVASLSLVRQQHVAAILPAQPAGHSLGKRRHLVSGLLVDPVGHGAVQVGGVVIDLARELILQAGEDIIELKRVGGKVHPARVGSEETQCLAGPQAVRFGPDRSLRVQFLRVVAEGFGVEVPAEATSILNQVLSEDLVPLVARDVLVKLLDDLRLVHIRDVQTFSELNVIAEFVPRLVVAVVEGARLEHDDACEALHVVDGGGSSDFSAVTVAANRGHRDFCSSMKRTMSFETSSIS